VSASAARSGADPGRGGFGPCASAAALGFALVAALTLPARAQTPADTVAARGAAHSAATSDSSSVLGEPGPADTASFRTNLDGLPIRRITVEPHGIFDPPPPGHFQAVYRMADALHVRTRPATVVHQLPFDPGDPWSAALGREALRTLRDLDILTPVRMDARRAGDSVDVHVVTRDSWSTALEFTIAGGGGKFSGSVSLTERNLFGHGKLLGVAYREEPTSRSRGVQFEDPAVFGSRLRVSAAATNGSDGASQGLAVGVPFVALASRAAYEVEWMRVTSVERLFMSDAEAAAFDRRHESTRVWVGRGTQRDGTVLRGQLGFLVDDRRFGPSRVTPEAPAEFSGDEENRKIRQLEVEGRWWRPRFVEKHGIEQMEVIEDFDLGTSVRGTLGYSPQFLGATADEGYVRASADAGTELGRLGFGWLSSEASTRLRRAAREGRGSLSARWATTWTRRSTMMLGVEGVALVHPARDQQVIFGGLDGLRAYGVNAATGERGWRLNAEERWLIRRDILRVISLGTATFVDVARVWGPGAEGSGWRQDVGAGLRLSLPRAAFHRVARFDVAWGVGGDRGRPSGPQISFGSAQAF
jgi:hypothetical protein